jgi:hypothetical protein
MKRIRDYLFILRGLLAAIVEALDAILDSGLGTDE